jgi:hypothetical protein
MTTLKVNSTDAFPLADPRPIPRVLSGAFRDLATKVVYFFLVAAVFVFVSIMLTGIHP